jgi:hypothetical protein
MSEGIAHTHDRRICWDCCGVGIVARSVSQKSTDKALKMIGWRYIEPKGRMGCPGCWHARMERAQGAQVDHLQPRLPF